MSHTVNMQLLVPFGYGERYETLEYVEDWLSEHHHPEYVRRAIPWLHSKAGLVGVGGGWRAPGTQPVGITFALEGRSFHGDQTYADGFTGATAVDLVARDGPDANFAHDGVSWAMVPAQGGAEAALWGVHANVGNEPWHLQPIEIDGWLSWKAAGSPAPKRGYKLPTDHPAIEPVPTGVYTVVPGDGWYAIARKTNTNLNELLALNNATLTTMLHPGQAVITGAPAVVDHSTWVTPPGYPSIRLGDTDASTVVPGWAKGRVWWLQGIIGVPQTGTWDLASATKLKELQKVGGVLDDGIYGPSTAALFFQWRGR